MQTRHTMRIRCPWRGKGAPAGFCETDLQGMGEIALFNTIWPVAAQRRASVWVGRASNVHTSEGGPFLSALWLFTSPTSRERSSCLLLHGVDAVFRAQPRAMVVDPGGSQVANAPAIRGGLTWLGKTDGQTRLHDFPVSSTAEKNPTAYQQRASFPYAGAAVGRFCCTPEKQR